MPRLAIEIQRLPHHFGLKLPQYQSSRASGMDLYAAVNEPLTIAPGQRASVPTGIAISVPMGHEGQVRARSGLSRDHGIGMANGLGTIDSGR